MEDVTYQFIDSQKGVDKIVAHMAGVESIALDSEADNLHHYETQLCLLQLRFDDTTYLLDLTVTLDLTAFWGELCGKYLIMHGSDFDLRLFQEFAGFCPQRLFDSMLASQLLGIKRIGLAALLEDFFEVKLPKDSQKSDWSQRPLTPKMLTYAANDVQYLFQLHEILMGRIKDLGREEWLAQRCNNQIAVAQSGFPRNNEHSWRIAKSDKLDERGQAAVFELWHWREELAKKLDRPPFKVLGNDYLLTLAEGVSESNWQFVFEGMPMGIRRRSRQGIVDALKRAEKRCVQTLPSRPARTEFRKPLTQPELDRQEVIKSYRNKVAEELEIDPTLIATRSVVSQLARDANDLSGILDWQCELLRPCLAEVESPEEE